MKKINTLEFVSAWEEMINTRYEEEIILFKYSPYCGTSYIIERKFDRWFKKFASDKSISCFKINVVNNKELSDKISTDLNIMHESPQIIWLDKDGKVKWYGSHFAISKGTLNKLLIN